MTNVIRIGVLAPSGYFKILLLGESKTYSLTRMVNWTMFIVVSCLCTVTLATIHYNPPLNCITVLQLSADFNLIKTPPWKRRYPRGWDSGHLLPADNEFTLRVRLAAHLISYHEGSVREAAAREAVLWGKGLWGRRRGFYTVWNGSVFSVLLVQSDSRLFHTMERVALLTSYSNVSNFGTLAPLLHLEVSTYFSYSGCKSTND